MFIMPRKSIPLSLTSLRLLLAPLMLALATFAPSPAGFAACLIAALLSDIFDGVIARRLGVATPGLRRLDSIADTLFYAACIGALWLLYPRTLAAHATPLLVLLGLELLRYGFDLLKFGREASYHMWSSKLWGLLLFLAFFSLLVLGRDSWLVDAAIVVGIVADLEGLMISWVLPHWRTDVASLLHASRIKRAG
jgi:phosphatidylglycerophosphate synthase